MYANILLSLIFCDIIRPNVKDRLSKSCYRVVGLTNMASIFRAFSSFGACADKIPFSSVCSFVYSSSLISITPRLGELRQLNLCYTKTARFINFSLRYLPITNLPIVLTMAHNYHQVKKDIRPAVEQVTNITLSLVKN